MSLYTFLTFLRAKSATAFSAS